MTKYATLLAVLLIGFAIYLSKNEFDGLVDDVYLAAFEQLDTNSDGLLSIAEITTDEVLSDPDTIEEARLSGLTTRAYVEAEFHKMDSGRNVFVNLEEFSAPRE